MRSHAISVLGMLAFLASAAGPASAGLINVVSDASALAAITGDITRLSTGNASGLTFVPAYVGGYGSSTPVPTGAPAGTLVINIPPGDGEYGFFMSTFTLPTAFSAVSLTGAGNVDDQGAVFLNGHLISGPLLGGSGLDEFDSRTFSTSIASDFVAGQNVLLIADDNSGGGPSAASYYATINFSAVPEPTSLALSLAAALCVGGKAGLARLRRRRAGSRCRDH